MKLYFAGPFFTTPERTWNAEVTAALRAAGHEVFLPQENEPGKDAAGIFAADKAGIDRADGLVAIMDGPAPDSGTCWEVGYAFGTKKSIVLVRTDFRAMAGGHDPPRPAGRLDHRGRQRDPGGTRSHRGRFGRAWNITWYEFGLRARRVTPPLRGPPCRTPSSA
jgi:nucleoside 2-deoxyribosyltransferase